MKPTVSVKQTVNHTWKMKQGMDLLTRRDVLVGIPAEGNMRKAEDGGEPAGNAVIGYVQEFGSPKQNIPARPFLKPGIAAVQGEVALLLGAAAKEAMRGNPAGVMASQTKIGLLAVNAVQARFASNDWQVLKAATLEARWYQEERKRREIKDEDGNVTGLRKVRKGRAKTPKATNPLVFTNSLRKAITYVIRGRS